MIRNREFYFGASVSQQSGLYRFEGLVSEIMANDAAEVIPALRRIVAAVQDGYYAVGFISYESAAVLDQSLPVQLTTGFPLYTWRQNECVSWCR